MKKWISKTAIFFHLFGTMSQLCPVRLAKLWRHCSSSIQLLFLFFSRRTFFKLNSLCTIIANVLFSFFLLTSNSTCTVNVVNKGMRCATVDQSVPNIVYAFVFLSSAPSPTPGVSAVGHYVDVGYHVMMHLLTFALICLFFFSLFGCFFVLHVGFLYLITKEFERSHSNKV